MTVFCGALHRSGRSAPSTAPSAVAGLTPNESTQRGELFGGEKNSDLALSSAPRATRPGVPSGSIAWTSSRIASCFLASSRYPILSKWSLYPSTRKICWLSLKDDVGDSNTTTRKVEGWFGSVPDAGKAAYGELGYETFVAEPEGSATRKIATKVLVSGHEGRCENGRRLMAGRGDRLEAIRSRRGPGRPGGTPARPPAPGLPGLLQDPGNVGYGPSGLLTGPGVSRTFRALVK